MSFTPSIKYLFFGVFSALLFPLVGTIVVAFERGVSLWQAQIVGAPLIWIIDTAPFVLGFTAWLLGRKQERIEALNKELLLNLSDLSFAKKMLDSTSLVSETYLDGRIRYVNERFCRISGYSRDELIGKNHSILNSGFHPQAFWGEMWGRLLGGENWQSLVCNRSKSGERYWVQSTMFPKYSEDGQLESFASARVDVTDLVRVHERATKLAMFSNLNPWIVVELNEQGFVEDFNPAAESAFNDEELRGGRWSKLLDCDESFMVVVEGTQRSFEHEVKLGQEDWLFHYRAVARGRSIFVYGSDISKLKELQRNLVHSAKLASIGELAAGVGHEINNPLAIAIGNLSRVEKILEKRGLLDEELLKALGKQRAANERIAKIVNGLRNYARADTDHKEKISMRQAIDDTLNLVSEIFDAEGIIIVDSTPELDFMVEGSYGKLQQVLMNLLVNARDAIRGIEGGQIELMLESREGSTAVLKISDNGCGIAKENIGRIFDPFFTTKSVGDGTGLGLGISAKIIADMGGQITVDSSPGHGTTFRLCFSVSSAKLDSIASAVVEGAVSNLLGGVNSILLVDDEKEIRDLLQEMLFELGASKVQQAENGAKALEMIKAEEFDVVMLDLKMPEMDGISLMRGIHNLNLKERPALIVLSGGVATNISRGGREELSQLVDGYVRKPFTFEGIQKVLKSVVSCLGFVLLDSCLFAFI